MFRNRSRPVSLTETLSPDEPRTENRDVADSFAPEQAVMPVAVAVVLICAPVIRFRRVVTAAFAGRGGVGRHNGGTLIEIEVDVAGEMNRAAQVSAGGEQHSSASRRGGSADGLVNRLGVERLAVARSPKRPHVEGPGFRLGLGCLGGALARLNGERGAGESRSGTLQKLPAQSVFGRHRLFSQYAKKEYSDARPRPVPQFH